MTKSNDKGSRGGTDKKQWQNGKERQSQGLKKAIMTMATIITKKAAASEYHLPQSPTVTHLPQSESVAPKQQRNNSMYRFKEKWLMARGGGGAQVVIKWPNVWRETQSAFHHALSDQQIINFYRLARFRSLPSSLIEESSIQRDWEWINLLYFVNNWNCDGCEEDR